MLAQTFGDIEVIVVDDASPELVIIPPDPRVRLVRAATNGGPARARNLGVEASNGDFLAFLDDDDTWTPSRLSYAKQGLDRSPIAICWQSPSGGRVLEGRVHDSILNATTPTLGATALRRSAWVPLDETYRCVEDLAWWLDVTKETSVTTVPKHGLVVRRHDGVRSGYGLEQRIIQSERLLTERTGYFAQHPRAAAFRWKRIGLMNLALGRKGEARKAFLRALGCQPSGADLVHLARTLLA